MDLCLYSTNWSKRSETEIDSFFYGFYLTREGSKLPLAMSSSIVLRCCTILNKLFMNRLSGL
jgi:hypothetical protein